METGSGNMDRKSVNLKKYSSMKAIKLTLLALVFTSAGAFAQKATQKAVIKTPNAACEECKDFLEARLGREEGITSVNVNYSRKTTTVTWITDRTNIEEIKAAIANLGFDADEITADETAYKRLPKCCVRPVPKTTPTPTVPKN